MIVTNQMLCQCEDLHVIEISYLSNKSEGPSTIPLMMTDVHSSKNAVDFYHIMMDHRINLLFHYQSI